MSQIKDSQPELKRLNLNVDTQLHNQFKAATAAEGKKMTDVLLEFIKEYVDKHQQPRKGRRG